ncbi:uncharacterized protein LOC123327558 [Bubalus bubalis]|uniref:uncharacterized protein LOC123327558 n=1 Tax=Bubalus bubalis TaxID=89462 RepID=UPI001D1179E0|nr:uncharacterized protein LOC123327558 [Bubalus bubalis]
MEPRNDHVQPCDYEATALLNFIDLERGSLHERRTHLGSLFASRSGSGAQGCLHSRPAPAAGAEHTHHLTRAPIGCCLLLTHVIGAGAPRLRPRPRPRPRGLPRLGSAARSCGGGVGRAGLRALGRPPLQTASLRAAPGRAAGVHKVAVPRCWCPGRGSARAAQAGRSPHFPPAKVLMTYRHTRTWVTPRAGWPRPSDLGVPLGEMHAPMASLSQLRESELGICECSRSTPPPFRRISPRTGVLES